MHSGNHACRQKIRDHREVSSDQRSERFHKRSDITVNLRETNDLADSQEIRHREGIARLETAEDSDGSDNNEDV